MECTEFSRFIGDSWGNDCFLFGKVLWKQV